MDVVSIDDSSSLSQASSSPGTGKGKGRDFPGPGTSYTLDSTVVPHIIKILKSDGIGTIPEQPTASGATWIRDDARAKPWKVKLSNATSKALGLPNDDWVLDQLPSGYNIYFSFRVQLDGSKRYDAYLFGSPRRVKYRSPSEFIPHLLWLLRDDSTIPCQCIHCKKNRGEGRSRDIETGRASSSSRVARGSRGSGMRRSRIPMIATASTSNQTFKPAPATLRAYKPLPRWKSPSLEESIESTSTLDMGLNHNQFQITIPQPPVLVNIPPPINPPKFERAKIVPFTVVVPPPKKEYLPIVLVESSDELSSSPPPEAKRQVHETFVSPGKQREQNIQFRVGEVVWAHCVFKDEKIEVDWPSIILERKVKSDGNLIGQDGKFQVRQRWMLKVRPLGLLNEYFFFEDGDELCPYLALSPPEFEEPVDPHPPEAMNYIFNGHESERPYFKVLMSGDERQWKLMLTHATQIATHIGQYFGGIEPFTAKDFQGKGYHLFDTHAVSEGGTVMDENGDMQEKERKRKRKEAKQIRDWEFFQGLWCGPEKIWCGDMLRLRTMKSIREEVKDYLTEEDDAMEEDEELRFLKLDAFYVDKDKVPRISGTTYVLRDTPSNEQDMTLPNAPPGKNWHRITPVTDQDFYLLERMAGRYYPVPVNKDVGSLNERERALCGLSAEDVRCGFRVWGRGRRRMCERSEEDADNEARGYWESRQTDNSSLVKIHVPINIDVDRDQTPPEMVTISHNPALEKSISRTKPGALLPVPSITSGLYSGIETPVESEGDRSTGRLALSSMDVDEEVSDGLRAVTLGHSYDTSSA